MGVNNQSFAHFAALGQGAWIIKAIRSSYVPESDVLTIYEEDQAAYA